MTLPALTTTAASIATPATITPTTVTLTAADPTPIDPTPIDPTSVDPTSADLTVVSSTAVLTPAPTNLPTAALTAVIPLTAASATVPAISIADTTAAPTSNTSAATSTATSTATSATNNVATPAPAARKRGRKPAFTQEQDLLILREVAAKKAHIADFGQKGAKFEEVTKALITTGTFKDGLECKSVQDRYHRLQRDFDKNDLKVSRMSGVGGEVTEAEELLSGMREARDDFLKQREAEKAKAKAIEERKLAAGRRMVDLALNRKKKRNKEGDEDGAFVVEESSSEDANDQTSDDSDTPKKKRKRRKLNHRGNLAGDLASFGESLHASDSAQLNFDREKLALEQERFSFERHEKERDRAERQQEREQDRAVRIDEREAQNKLELDKFKLMMDVFSRRLDQK